jgi:two-component system chemotaxis response regulator CheY
MSQSRILNVGQCAYDHANMVRQFSSNLHATLTAAETFDDALAELRSRRYDLVLVNRVTDADGAPGVDLIRTLKSDPALSSIPVMLVSDFTEAQAEAVALGALPGFGKSDLRGRAVPLIVASALGSRGA